MTMNDTSPASELSRENSALAFGLCDLFKDEEREETSP